jgi:hypothetical protein
LRATWVVSTTRQPASPTQRSSTSAAVKVSPCGAAASRIASNVGRSRWVRSWTRTGNALLDHLEVRGAALGCRFLELDSGVQREGAHRFYRRVGMRDDSLHFRRPIPAA